MQATLRMLFAGIVALLSLQAVDSLSPISKRRSQLLTLPLTPIQRRSDIHPQILLQMHINRGIRRLARATGVEPPSVRSLEERLEKRVLSIEGPEGFYRRFNRIDVPRSTKEVQLEKRFNQAGSVSNSGPEFSSSTSNVQFAHTPNAPNSLGLDIQSNDLGYFATVQIGTPLRDFFVLMDSGSADFWVGGENCRSQDGGCGNHTFLGKQSSSSFKNTTRTFVVSYETGRVVGSVVQDNVVIAGLSLTNHVFGVASLETPEFSSNNTPYDGLMGLAKSNPLSTQGTPTPIESLASAGLVSAPIVSYKIPRLADNLHDGEITFGGLDNTKFDSKTLVSVQNISPQGFWEANLDGATVNGVDTGLTGRTTILDTGTNLMLLPAADAAAIHKNIPGAQPDGQGGFILPCTTNASVALIYGGQSFTIDPRDLANQPLDDNNLCFSGIATQDDGPTSTTQWLVGDTFLKNAYFSTDISKNTVSLAKLVSKGHQ